MTSENEKALADANEVQSDGWSGASLRLVAHVRRLVAEVEDYAAKERLRRDNFKAAVDRAEQLASRVKALEAALKPFAEYAAIVWDGAHATNPIGDACPPKNLTGPDQWRNAKPLPTLGDCRRALALLSEVSPS